MKVLFLTAWYPHRKDDMEGLFVRKHAMSVGLHHQVNVIFLKAEDELQLPRGKVFEKETSYAQNVRETYYYYPKARHIFGKIRRFLHIYRLAFNAYKAEYGKPDIIHVSVLTRHGVVARLLQILYGIPYVVTEHWTRYYRKPFRNGLHKALTRSVARHASCLMPVSENLAEAMRACGLRGHYEVVRNVVDDFFYLKNASSDAVLPPDGIKTILHICCFCEEQKNNFGLLRAVKELSRERNDFRLVMVGTGVDFDPTRHYAEKLRLPREKVEFMGKIQPPEVKQQLEKSCFL
ncbi:MAG: glycosyltransferase, partial [Bacteroidales bacterium]|nr:glycosyltransferase [Bacteroidales bacterium]